MANAIYPLYKQALMDADTDVDLIAGNVKVALVDTGTYTYNAAHQFLSDLTGITATSGNLASKTVTNGVFDAADLTLTAVSGNQSEALVFYIDTTVAGTSRLVAYLDTGQTGLPVTPNGGDIDIVWNASGIFAL